MLKKFRALLWVALLLPSIITAADDAPVVLVVGDSLSAGFGLAPQEGWVALLDRRLAAHNPRFRVVNASVTGDTTLNGRNRLAGLLDRQRPMIVIIELGANDGLRGISDRVLADNLRGLVETSKGAGARVLLLGIRLPPNYGAAFNARFDRVFGEVARETETPLVPFFLEGVAEDRDLMLPDGLHPAAEAQPILLDNVWPALEPLLEATRAQTAPVSAPAATSG